MVILNSAHPALAYKAVSEGRLVFERDVERRVEFEVRALKAYLDLRPLLLQARGRLIREFLHGEE